jgi:Flp pilus assembly protein TadG
MTPIISSLANAASLWQRLSGCARVERGVSTVEFALILPLMVTLYLGGVEVSQGLTIDRKVTLVARTVADLAAQAQTIANSDMTNILNASTAVLLPYSIDKTKVTVSQVKIDPTATRPSTGATARTARPARRVRPSPCRRRSTSPNRR